MLFLHNPTLYYHVLPCIHVFVMCKYIYLYNQPDIDIYGMSYLAKDLWRYPVPINTELLLS